MRRSNLKWRPLSRAIRMRRARRTPVRGRQVMTVHTSLDDLITFAYGIHAKQIIGAPSWAESDKYDVTGQPAAEGSPNSAQLRGMIQKLLADRFKLTFHREKRELPVYAITLSKTGHKLTKNDSNPGGLPSLFFRGLGTLPAANATMGDFAGVMQSAVLDRPVIDQTGLAGRWDFTLNWTPDEFQFGGLGVRPPAPTNDPAAPPNIFNAFKEQLGLQLESTKAPAEVYVVDKVEKPSEN
ncbi:MAG: TIGR03435 family protein [Acidobacteriota bacterium]